jgi:hypothetical protein
MKIVARANLSHLSRDDNDVIACKSCDRDDCLDDFIIALG